MACIGRTFHDGSVDRSIVLLIMALPARGYTARPRENAIRQDGDAASRPEPRERFPTARRAASHLQMGDLLQCVRLQFSVPIHARSSGSAGMCGAPGTNAYAYFNLIIPYPDIAA
jgi:hypothetical protein